jgi:hypothetical protein
MALVTNLALVCKWRGFAIGKLGFPNTQVNSKPHLFMTDYFLSSLAVGRSAILTLPMKMGVVNPMVKVAMV